MRSCFSLFFGLLFIILGLDIILRFFFKISIPLMKILFAFFFIYLGVSILVGRPLFGTFYCHTRGENADAFGEYSYNLKDKEISKEKISVIFGSKRVDLSGMKVKGKKASIKVECIFGEMKVRLDKDIPIRISGSSAFGQLVLPGNNRISFGSNKYSSKNFSEDIPYIDMDAACRKYSSRIFSACNPI